MKAKITLSLLLVFPNALPEMRQQWILVVEPCQAAEVVGVFVWRVFPYYSAAREDFASRMIALVPKHH